MKKTRVLIVEDEFIIAEDISETLRELDYVVVGNATNYNEAISAFETQQIDVVLVDINLGEGKDGIDVGKELRENYQLPFIFITSHADKTTVDKAKNLKPNGYLVKPFDKNDLYTSIEIALANFSKNSSIENNQLNEQSTSDTIFIKDGTTFIKLKFNDIWFIKSESNYVSITTEAKKYLIRKTLKEFGALLPETKFFQISKSYIINLTYIEAVHSDHVLIKQQEIPIGREFKDDFVRKVNLG